MHPTACVQLPMHQGHSCGAGRSWDSLLFCSTFFITYALTLSHSISSNLSTATPIPRSPVSSTSPSWQSTLSSPKWQQSKRRTRGVRPSSHSSASKTTTAANPSFKLKSPPQDNSPTSQKRPVRVKEEKPSPQRPVRVRKRKEPQRRATVAVVGGRTGRAARTAVAPRPPLPPTRTGPTRPKSGARCGRSHPS